MLIAVNFHYVRPVFDAPHPGIHGITPDELAAQLELLGSLGDFVSGEQLASAAEGRLTLPERAFIITFDDGLREQYEYARPVLERLGVPALYFINTAPIADGVVCPVHKIHLVRSRMAPGDFITKIMAATRGSSLERQLEEAGTQAVTQYKYDAPDTARIKYALNFLLPRAQRDRIITECFADLFADGESAVSEALYMDRAQVEELSGLGFIGTHGHRHVPLGLLAREDARDDIERSVEQIARWTGRRPFALSYPYGSYEACTPSVARLAAAAGLRFAFTMERAGNGDLARPHHLARFACNDLPGGRSSVLRGDALFTDVSCATWYAEPASEHVV